jgi:VWFA-related protein
MRRLFADFALIWGAFASLTFVQSGDARQRLVELTVAATDAKGDPVADLRPEEVQVREGTLRSVAFFRFAGSKRAVLAQGPGEFVNRAGPPPMLILLDRWNERLTTMSKASQALGEALSHLESVERVYVYILTGRGDLLPVRPLPGVDIDLQAEPPTPAELVAKLKDAVRTTEGIRYADSRDPAQRANTTFQALGIFKRMDLFAGRKDLVWISHGIPLNATLLDGSVADFTAPVQDLAETAARSQVAIYTVAEAAEGPGADPIGQTRQTLRMFSAITGGRAYPSGQVESAITDAMADAHGSYRIAYYSPARENGGKEHKIRLDSSRKGIRLLTREGYFGEETDSDLDQWEDTVFGGLSRSPFDATGISLRVVMSRPAPGTIHFEVHVDPADVLLERRGTQLQGSLILRCALYGKSANARRILERGGGATADRFLGATPAIQKDFTITEEQFKSLKDGIVVPQDVQADSDLQQIRVMVLDRALRDLGSVTIPAK